MKTLAILSTATALLSLSASAANFMLVTAQGTGDGYHSFLTTNFPDSTISTGTFDVHTDQATINAVAAADLIIISRNTNSSDYSSSATERQFWNSISKPLILSSNYIARGGGSAGDARLGWINSGSRADGQSTVGSETTLTTEGASYFGLMAGTNDLLGGSGVDASAPTGTGLGGGTLLGSVNGNITIANWASGSNAANGDTFGGDRLYFAAPGSASFSSTGTTALTGAINNLIPEPSTSLLAATALGMAALRRRR